MHVATIQTVSAQQTKLNNNYKNSKLKKLKTNAERNSLSIQYSLIICAIINSCCIALTFY